MTRDQEERAKRLAKLAAWHDLRESREQRAQWWVGESSQALGIVDRHGIVDLSGPIARLFIGEYTRVYRRG